MENILEITTMAFQGDAMKRLSSVIHESPNATKRGIETAVPASLAGLAAHTSSSQGGAAALLGTFRGGDYPHVDASDVGNLVDDPAATARMAQSGHGFLSQMFGSKLSGIVDALAGQSGVSRSSASTLLGLAAPLVLSAIGKEAQTRNLDAAGLSSFLAEQGRKASSALPGSLSTALGAGSVLGGAEQVKRRPGRSAEDLMNRARDVGNGAKERAADNARRFERASADVAHTEHRPGRGIGWLLGGLAALGVLGFLFFRPKNVDQTMTPPGVHIPAPDMPAMPKVPDIALPKVNMPNMPAMPELPKIAAPETPQPQTVGQLDTLTPASGVSALSLYLSGTEPTPRRFVLRGIEFPTSSTALTSTKLLDDVAATLAEHPTTQIRLDGNTDSTGGTVSNQQLSTARAISVKDYLVAHGVAANRIEAVGHGSEMPLVTGDDSPAAHAQNRRVELVVTGR